MCIRDRKMTRTPATNARRRRLMSASPYRLNLCDCWDSPFPHLRRGEDNRPHSGPVPVYRDNRGEVMRARIFALAAAVLLAACGSSTTTTPPAGTAKVSPPPNSALFTAGTLTIGSDVSYPPQEFYPVG